MTWIVGTAPPFGSAILVSDICATSQDSLGKAYHLDCIQKIYPLGRFVLGGFSGSVQIGLKVLGTLQVLMHRIPEDEAWNVLVVQNWIKRVIRKIYRESSESDRALGCSIILAWAHPTKNNGVASWARTYVHVFRSVDFEPQCAKVYDAVAIGSGAHAQTVMEGVKQFCGDISFLQTAVAGHASQARVLAQVLTDRMTEQPIPGVSSLFQVGVVTRGQIMVQNHEYALYEAGRKTEYRFPPIARNWSEFVALAQKHGWSAEGAVG
jgi:hypothetical protein